MLREELAQPSRFADAAILVWYLPTATMTKQWGLAEQEDVDQAIACGADSQEALSLRLLGKMETRELRRTTVKP